MQMVNAALIAIAICGAAMLTAQEPSSLAVAKAIDQEILKLRDLPDDVRARAIKDLALRIRQQPQRYAVALASNLAIDGTEAGGRDTLQEVATTLADALRKSPTQDIGDRAYRMLAELARYYHVEVSLDDPRYTAAIFKLRADDQHRSEADFTLTDVQEQKWNLKSLRGKVVLVNFWATWCPPCRREIPDLDALYKRFRDQGLVILAITDEEASIVRPFISQQKVSYPVLLDRGQKVKELFRVDGIPESFVYDREERLVAQAIDRPTMQGFLEMLAQAGLQ
jgi:thiol-disulfide isomerase/thioredoxin